MSKEILIARPNAFIVKNMKMFLRDCGKEPVVANHFEDIEKQQRLHLGGVVISTAVTSSMDASFEQVFKKVIDKFPNIPILLPTLLKADRAKNTITHALKSIGNESRVVTISELLNGSEVQKGTLLVAEKSDIAPSDSYNKVVEMTKLFFN